MTDFGLRDLIKKWAGKLEAGLTERFPGKTYVPKVGSGFESPLQDDRRFVEKAMPWNKQPSMTLGQSATTIPVPTKRSLGATGSWGTPSPAPAQRIFPSIAPVQQASPMPQPIPPASPERIAATPRPTIKPITQAPAPVPERKPPPIPIPTPAPGATPIPAIGSPYYYELIKKHFPQDQWENASRVMEGESSVNAYNWNHNPKTDKSEESWDYGLFQINDIHEDVLKNQFGYTVADMYDPEKNVIFAAELWKWNERNNPRGGWFPWKSPYAEGLWK